MTSPFAHLHVHTEFSMLDGAAKVDDLLKAAAADGQPAIAMTDHGNMYGVIDFYKACQKYGVKPIIGTEAYMAKNHVSERPMRRKGVEDDFGGETEEGSKLYYHLTLLAENNTGYKNMIQLASRAYLEGYYIKPRVDWDILNDHSDGIIATSGCLGGQVLQALLKGRKDTAIQIAGRLQDIFGKDNFFIELQNHGIEAQFKTMNDLVDVARAIGAPLVATNDSHYVTKEDAHSHDILLCVQTRSALDNPDRFKFEGEEHYLKPAREMRSIFKELPEACDSTLLIAERSNVQLDFGSYRLPKFPVPWGYKDVDAYLQSQVFAGARNRWGTEIPEEITERLAYELKVIADMGFSSYFLIVADIVEHATKVGIRVGAGRGSAAGSAVSYALGITKIDPIKNNLLFERFLNPARVSMPDIDLDMTTTGRDEMIRYAAEKYGQDHVAQVVTFSTIKARAAVRDSARVLGMPFTLGDKISKAMPAAVMGKEPPLHASFEPDPEWESFYVKAEELRNLYATSPEVKEVIDVAMKLENLKRQDGIHAAAVVISDVPLTNIVPLQRKGEGNPIVTQYDMYGVEDLGLLKMDFLGLRNLDVITECLRVVKESKGIDVDIDNVTLDDPATYRLLREGDTVGVFQLESKPMRDLLRRLAPTDIEDIAATVALYRPGPMAANMHNDYADRKNKRQVVTYFHPAAEDILRDTYGLMIYQEQVMQVAQRFAGYTLAESDLLRKAIGKKNKVLLHAEQDKFLKGCAANGHEEHFALELFSMIEKFADYAFNRSHACGYGYLAYQTAYLKANYPTQYFAALCTKAKDIETASVFLADARAHGIPIKLPSVNESDVYFTATDEEIRVGLSSIREASDTFSIQVVEERNENGSFKDIFDFCVRMLMRNALTKRQLVPLIESGAVDEFGNPRLGLSGVVEELLKVARKEKEQRENGMMQLFASEPSIDIPDVEYPDDERLRLEKRVMGVFVSGHPMDGMDEWVHDNATATLVELSECPDETIHTVCGMIVDISLKQTRAGEEMAHFILEDPETQVRVTAFPKNWAKVRGAMKVEHLAAVRLRATTDNRGERDLVLISADVVEREEPVISLHENVKLYLPRGFYDNAQAVAHLKGIIMKNRGKNPVVLHLGPRTAINLPDEYAVTPGEDFVNDVKAVFEQYSSANS